MENTDSLQTLINKAKEKLPQNSIEAINSFDWKSIISKINDRLTEIQLDTLEIETELVLCGIVKTEDYSKELMEKMGLPEIEVSMLLNDLNKSIFEKIRIELEKLITQNIDIPLPPYYKKEEVVKNNEQKIGIKIENAKTNNSGTGEEGIYKKSGIEMIEEKEPEVEISKESIKEDSTISNLGNSGINVVNDTPEPKEAEIPQTENDKSLIEDIEHPENLKNSILSNKLSNNSVSQTTISDHTLPKIKSVDSLRQK